MSAYCSKKTTKNLKRLANRHQQLETAAAAGVGERSAKMSSPMHKPTRSRGEEEKLKKFSLDTGLIIPNIYIQGDSL